LDRLADRRTEALSAPRGEQDTYVFTVLTFRLPDE